MKRVRPLPRRGRSRRGRRRGFLSGRIDPPTSTAASPPPGARRRRTAAGSVLARPDGPRAAVRQARQVALHGHAARSGLCRQRAVERRAGERGGAAEPRHPLRHGPSRRRCPRRSTRSARCSSTNVATSRCRRASPATSSASPCARRWSACARARRWRRCSLRTGSGRRTSSSRSSEPACRRRPRRRGSRRACAPSRFRTIWSAGARRPAPRRRASPLVVPGERRRRRARCARRRRRHAGMTLFRIAGLRDRLGGRRGARGAGGRGSCAGQKVKATLQADPSQTFEGELKEILPEVSSDDANAQGTVRGRQPRRQADAGDAAAARRRRAAERAPGRAVGSRHPHRQARGRHRAQRAGWLRTARRVLGADFGDDVEVARRAERRRPGRRQRTVPHRLGSALALGARQHGAPASAAAASTAARQRRTAASTTPKARSKA